MGVGVGGCVCVCGIPVPKEDSLTFQRVSRMQGDGGGIRGSIQRSSSYDLRIFTGTPVNVLAKLKN